MPKEKRGGEAGQILLGGNAFKEPWLEVCLSSTRHGGAGALRSTQGGAASLACLVQGCGGRGACPTPGQGPRWALLGAVPWQDCLTPVLCIPLWGWNVLACETFTRLPQLTEVPACVPSVCREVVGL